MKLIKQGAEANIYLDNNVIIKQRISKNYRIKEIDKVIRKFRTRREAKVIEKIENAPKIIKFSDKDMTIEMEYIDGKVLSQIFDGLNDKEKQAICMSIGENIAELHNKDIIHGDLTTANMILKDKIYFIDFGLSFFSNKIEDKAVDIHLLKEVLKSKHYNNYEKYFDLILKGYKISKDYNEIISRLKKVESRGRYKKKNLNN
ncbi:Kae1-associated serine/threonine protein kinase [Candidatus Woesearchaeota archaeon]|nr:Kae1-associated serine/threonine protein kinase [Candidatus Woesearchaeota archaeon]